MTERDFWKKTVSFHGHECPGLAIGFKAALLAKELLQVDDHINDEDIVCVSETDACGIDAFQVILNATVGSGSMRLQYKGKNAFSVYNRKNGLSVRLVWKDDIKALSKSEKLKIILKTPAKELFSVKNTKGKFPERAMIYKSAPCVLCGELTAENALIDIDGKLYCWDCEETV